MRVHSLRESSQFGVRLMARTFEAERRKPLKAALPRSDEELDRLSQIQQADYDAALAEVEPATRAMLEAEEHEA